MINDELTIADLRAMFDMMDGAIPVRLADVGTGKTFTISRQPAMEVNGREKVVYLAMADDAGPLAEMARVQLTLGDLAHSTHRPSA